MSARDRAQSRDGDREEIAYYLESKISNGYATEWRLRREERLKFLDDFFSDLDINAISSAATISSLKLSPDSPEAFREAWILLTTGLQAREQLYQNPHNVKEVAPRAKLAITAGYESLIALGYATRPNENFSQE